MDGYRLPSADELAPRAWAGLAVVAAASFVATLDAMVLYVAFGSIRRDFPGVSAAALSWIAIVGRAAPGELLSHHRIAWWLVAAAGVAVTATSWPLPRMGSATRGVERDHHLTVLRPRAARTSPILGGEPATTPIRRVPQEASA